MVATFDTARDEILGAFYERWTADTPAVTGGPVPLVFFEGIGSATEPPHDAPWARVSIRHSFADQATLSDALGQRRFEKFGLVTVQVFAPLELGQGLALVEALAKVAKAAFEGQQTESNVWFQAVRINEVGPDGPWYQMNVIAEFRYDELV